MFCLLTLLLIHIRYVSASSGKTLFIFDISSQKCGTETQSSGNTVSLSNVIVVQNDESIQEIWDVARQITCSWVENYVKKIKFNPFTVGMLNAEEIEFDGGEKLDCWMDIQLGSYPDIRVINSVVPIGEKLSLLIYLRDNKGTYDVAIKDCYAYGGANYENENTPKIVLTNENGCVVKEKLISNFQKVRENDSKGSVIVAHATISAFKFPDVMDVYMACNMEVCKGLCEDKCGIYPTERPRKGSTLFGEPRYTNPPIKCFPGSLDPSCTALTTPSTLIRCIPGSLDPACRSSHNPEPSNQNIYECTPGSNDPNCRINCEKYPEHPSCFKIIPTSAPICNPGSLDPRCPKPFTIFSLQCYLGSSDPRCNNLITEPPIICLPQSNDPRCPKPIIDIPFKCFPGSTDPRCQEPSRNCYPGSNDIRCRKPTEPPLNCFPGSNDIRCRKPTEPSLNCYPGSRDHRCPFEDTGVCLPGSTHPKCQQQISEPTLQRCVEGSLDPKCLKEKDIPLIKCVPGSKDPRCINNFPVKQKSICTPESTNPQCVTTNAPRRGSILFPVTQTTKRSGGLFPDNFATTTKPPSPSLKPDTSNTVKNKINPGRKEPKPKPEPIGKEWEGESKYHAFHSFHYDKGDGRRRNRAQFGKKLKRTKRSEERQNPNNIKTLSISSRILVAPIPNTKMEKRMKREIMTTLTNNEERYYNITPIDNDSVCISFGMLTVGVVLSIFAFFAAVFCTLRIKK